MDDHTLDKKMSVLQFLLIIVLFFDFLTLTTPVDSITATEICSSYTNLSDPWRNRIFYSRRPNTDDSLTEGWYRFIGIGGDVLYHYCVSDSRTLSLCDTDYSSLIEGQVHTLSLCSSGSCSDYETVDVLLCPGGFYLHKLFPTDKTFITAHKSCGSSSCGVNAYCYSYSNYGSCYCIPGFSVPSGHVPTGDFFGCEGSCPSYANLSDPWRNVGFTSTSFPGWPKRDSTLYYIWYRFTGVGGDVLYDNCTSTAVGGGTSKRMVICDDNSMYFWGQYNDISLCYQTYGGCFHYIPIYRLLCPEGFYLYRLHRHYSASYITRHQTCGPSSCGPNAQCVGDGRCECKPGYEMPEGLLPTGDSYQCKDLCSSYANCSNPWRNRNFFQYRPNTDANLAKGWYRFTGIGGDVLYRNCDSDSRTLSLCNTDYSSLIEGHVSTLSLCSSGSCSGTVDVLLCPGGFFVHKLFPTDKTFITGHQTCGPSSCGQNAQCFADGHCECKPGYKMHKDLIPTGDSYQCEEEKTCETAPQACDDSAKCINTDKGFYCTCPSDKIPSIIKTNTADKKMICKDLPQQDSEGTSSEKKFELLNNMIKEVSDDDVLPPSMVSSLLVSVEKALPVVGQDASGEKLAAAGDAMLQSTEKLAGALVEPTSTQISRRMATTTTEVETFAIGKDTSVQASSTIESTKASMDIDLIGIAKNNDGSAAVALTTFTNMGSLLRADFFHTVNDTVKTMMSEVLSASLPKTPNKDLPSPANITIKHIQTVDPQGELTCVYWNGSAWVVDGCSLTHSNTTHTVCTCEHFSTFALIMQVERPPETDPMMELLNRISVSVGLGFLILTIVTLALCRQKYKVTDVAHLNLCISLFLAHLLFLLVQEFIHFFRPQKVVCSVLSGVLHYLFLSSFAWMLLETIWLFHAVLRLKDVRSTQAVGPHWGWQCLIGYGGPFAVVAVSVGLVPDGYGSDRCWLNYERGFFWSFLGPVCCILGTNAILFLIILIILRTTLSRMQHGMTHDKLIRTLVFKTLIQSVIVGLPWILGFFSRGSRAMDVLFHVLNSQQGTFIFLLHCVLNEEVRQQIKRRCCGRKTID